MSTQSALPLPGPLISQIETAAEAEHVTPEQFVQNLLAKHLDDKGHSFAAGVWREGDWYVSQCLQVDVASQGATEEEALQNLREALELYFEPPRPTSPPKIYIVEVETGAA